jgi:hypothetical protein
MTSVMQFLFSYTLLKSFNCKENKNCITEVMLPLSHLLVFLFPLKYVIMSHNPVICKEPGLPLFSSLSAT